MNKKSILTAATVLLIGVRVFAQDYANLNKLSASENNINTNSSQELDYQIHGRYSRPVTTEKLNEAKILNDFIDGYPTNWIDEYVSVEILATCNGKVMNAVSANDKLNAAQKNILKTADLATDIAINVKYKVTNGLINREMYVKMTVINIKMTVIPETEAEYIGGHQQLKKYLKENVINKISETNTRHLQEAKATAIFTVNEEGEITNAKISETSGDAKTDKLLVEAINKMPKWKPAQNSKGVKVKQEFEFSVGNTGC